MSGDPWDDVAESDLKVDVRSHGVPEAGTYSCSVRITHLPSGCSAQSDEGRSQIQAKAQALELLRAEVRRNWMPDAIASARGPVAEDPPLDQAAAVLMGRWGVDDTDEDAYDAACADLRALKDAGWRIVRAPNGLGTGTTIDGFEEV